MNKRDLINLPNALSLARIGLTPLFLLLLAAENWEAKVLAFVVFSIASLTDFYDGRLARQRGHETSVGRFLDPLADKILVTSALVAFALGSLVKMWLVLPVIVRDVAITLLRLYGIYSGRQLVTSRLAKWKTAFQLFSVVAILFAVGVEALLEHMGNATGGTWLPWLSNGLMAAVLFLTLLSGGQYFRDNFFKAGAK
jgi:CDP-diacylglycerol--glycerol-3-phosphate 3-phosphatidyltransferase